MPESVLPEPDAPAITIVVPSLNQGQYLDTALRSLIDQQYPRLDVVVIDGGSTDGSGDVLRRWSDRLSHWQSSPDAGPAAALQQGFAFARGTIYGVLNADDFLLPGALAQIARSFAVRPDVDVISGHGYFAGASGELGTPLFSDAWDARRFRYGACVLVQPATFFRRTAYERAGGFARTGRTCWDMELWAAMARSGARFATIDAYLAAFRLHERSITGRDELRAQRRSDARAVAAEFGGGPDSLIDRVLHYVYRAGKVARHPGRTLMQRRYVKSVLKRWSV